MPDGIEGRTERNVHALRPGVALARDRSEHDARVAFLQGGVAEASAVENAAAKFSTTTSALGASELADHALAFRVL